MKRILSFFVLIIIVCSTCLAVSCVPNNIDKNIGEDNEQSDDEAIKVYNQIYFKSLEESKMLLKSDFLPLFPTIPIGKHTKYDSYSVLNEEYNYLLFLDSSLPLANKETKRYDSYSLVYFYPIIQDGLVQYGLTEDDLREWAYPIAWIDEDYIKEKLSSRENADELAKSLSDMLFAPVNKYYFPTKLNELDYHYITNKRISYVQFNAYDESHVGNEYPQIKTYLDKANTQLKTWELEECYIEGIKVKITIGEERDKFLEANRIYHGELVEFLDLVLDGENNVVIKSFCSITFEKNGIIYEINYPLIYRIMDKENNDFGSANATDGSKLINIAKKSAFYFVGLLI